MDLCRSGALGRYAAGVAILLALSACYEEKDQTIASGGAAAPADTDAAWLTVDDARAPAEFLATQSGLPDVTLAALLDALSAQYRESPRMIANRVLQLWREYPDTPLDRLMAGLTPPPVAAPRSLGPVAQQYRVRRGQGADHATAIADAMEDTP